nr:MAG TPA: hypothetical protein [Caudoviricetes sp.]
MPLLGRVKEQKMSRYRKYTKSLKTSIKLSRIIF